MKVFKSMLVLLLAASTPLVLADEQRQHGAHEHGVGKLDFAQEGTVLHIELDSPAVNIVGFEHAPNSEEDHETLERALAQLKDGATLFELPGTAGCRLVSADAHTPLVDHEEGEAHHDDEHHEEHEPHNKHEQRHEESHEHEATHADITATWRFDCVHPEALDRVKVRVFEAFPRTERLLVQFITEKRQGAAELGASQPELRF
ncbi:MAG: hypothetical protein B0D96_09980 [Candidatus Sedimenticola endophacoides]|nr:MAG: hypothetical protein B0D96_09980 [Candidatus Sedimenticola endophacoides]OQX46896.1 MAG: hypothetical protein B0D85_02795 [Candidatus Sedimenticola endophacoides]OQX48716.1 MAG: hypothetical protein B0D87_04260 [Candidatus Sedimenticola endophacoides]